MPWNVRDYPASMKNLDRSPRVKQKNGMTMQMKRRRKLFRKRKIRKKTIPIKPIKMRKN